MKQTVKERMLPCWLMFRWISRYSIGWRMGAGEEYRYQWLEWLERLSLEEKKTYIKQFPEPKSWIGFWEEFQERELEESELDEYVYSNKFHAITFWEKKGLPSYALSDLLQEVQAGKQKNYLYFWKTGNNSTITKGCLSQWWMRDFKIDTITYCCMEQYMMAEKARLFGDKQTEEKILECNNPSKIKALGRKVKGFDETVWEACRYSIVLNGNYYKFLQNKDLWEFLNATKDKVLVEASPYDGIWGISIAQDKKEAADPNQWKGMNLLGFALMEVREELRRILAGIKEGDEFETGL